MNMTSTLTVTAFSIGIFEVRTTLCRLAHADDLDAYIAHAAKRAAGDHFHAVSLGWSFTTEQLARMGRAHIVVGEPAASDQRAVSIKTFKLGDDQ